MSLVNLMLPQPMLREVILATGVILPIFYTVKVYR